MDKNPAHPILEGICLAAIAYSLWSLINAAFKWLGQELPLFPILFWGDVFALLAVCAFHKQLGGFQKTFRTRHLKIHLLRGLAYTLYYIAIIWALIVMPLANSYSVFFISPILAIFLAILLLGEKPRPHHWVAAAGGLAGVIIILRPNLELYGLGVILSLCAALFFALGNIASRKVPPEETRLSLGLYCVFMTLLVTGVLMLSDFAMPNAKQMAVLALCGSASGLAVILCGRAFILAPVAVVSSFSYINMVWAVILGYAFFGDFPDRWTWTGSALIIGSGLWLIYREAHNKHN